eukprot:762826-Hanusia_phi.AAC.3
MLSLSRPAEARIPLHSTGLLVLRDARDDSSASLRFVGVVPPLEPFQPLVGHLDFHAHGRARLSANKFRGWRYRHPSAIVSPVRSGGSICSRNFAGLGDVVWE